MFSKYQRQPCLGLTYIMQLLKAYGSVPTSNYTCRGGVASAHIPKCTLTWLLTRIQPLQRGKDQSERESLLFSANTDIVMSEMASEVEGFPPSIVYFVNE